MDRWHPTLDAQARTNSEERNDEATTALRQGRHLRRDGGAGCLPRELRSRARVDQPGLPPHLADQRLRLLPGHALEGSRAPGRDAAAALFAGRLAGMPVL